MKEYENTYKIKLPKRSYTIIRLDGKSFHTFTKGLERPYSIELMNVMNMTMAYVFSEMAGAKLGYVQSDEISFLLTDFDELTTQPWFSNNIQKIVSVSASLATAYFNRQALIKLPDSHKQKYASFDSRVFQLPYSTEVENYFIWRQMDCTHNSLSSLAQTILSQRQLQGKGRSELLELCKYDGQPWEELNEGFKMGRWCYKDDGRLQLMPSPDFLTQREKLKERIPLHA